MPFDRLWSRWRMFWLWHAGCGWRGRIGTRLGSIGAGPYRRLQGLVWVAQPKGYIAASARVIGLELRMGLRVFIAERVLIARWAGDGTVALGEAALVNREATIELFDGGSVTVGSEAGIQMRSHIQSVRHPVSIGDRAMLAPYCVVDSGQSCPVLGTRCRTPALEEGGPISIGNDTWLGTGATILGGVTVGEGAVVAAGAVVTEDIPPGAIAAGNPARIIKHRDDLETVSR